MYDSIKIAKTTAICAPSIPKANSAKGSIFERAVPPNIDLN